MVWLVALGLLLLLLTTACDAIVTPPAPTPTETALATSAHALATPTIAPEIYLTPIPPTPTFTPSPTPTPVIHIVVSGDTLFGIALDYGVTVDGLLRMNGLEESDFLRIGQALIIPVDEGEVDAEGDLQAPVGSAILPTPTPLPLTTSGTALYETPVGGLWCMGEVVNTTSEPVTNLKVAVTLLAPDGTPLITARTQANADYLSPGSRAPFSLLFRSPPAGVTDAQVILLRGESISPITAGFVPLDVLDADGAVSGPQYRVRGTLSNSSQGPVSRVSVVVTVYNAASDVVGYRQLMIPDVTLSPGQQQPFDVLLTPQQVEPPSEFSVIAWASTG
jgi:LysM repeat protein